MPQFGLASRRPSSVLPVLSRGTRRMRQVSPVAPSSLTRTVASISSISPLRRIYSLLASLVSPSLDSKLSYAISATCYAFPSVPPSLAPLPRSSNSLLPLDLSLPPSCPSSDWPLVVPPRSYPSSRGALGVCGRSPPSFPRHSLGPSYQYHLSNPFVEFTPSSLRSSVRALTQGLTI